ncbi:MAG: hypothetical protein ACO3NK_20760, partial [Prochlorotrichaceae cyanobacterium]
MSEQGRARAFVELLANRLGGQTSEQFQQLAPPRIEDIRRLAQEQQATLVEYSILSSPKGDDRLLIWVIQPNGVVNLRTTALSAEQNSSGENGGNSPSRGLRITRPVETLVVATREQTTQG